MASISKREGFSFIQYESDGVQVNYPFSFSYISKEYIYVEINDAITLDYTYVNDNEIILTTAAPSGAIVTVRRDTNAEGKIVDFVDGGIITEKLLDTQFDQVLDLVQEAKDVANSSVFVDISTGTSDASNSRIINLSDPVGPQDAVNKRTLDAAIDGSDIYSDGLFATYTADLNQRLVDIQAIETNVEAIEVDFTTKYNEVIQQGLDIDVAFTAVGVIETNMEILEDQVGVDAAQVASDKAQVTIDAAQVAADRIIVRADRTAVEALSPGNYVILTATQTLTNKTLTSPVINTPTGIVKADVGLGNVDNTSDTTKNASAATLTNKTLTSPVINTPTGIVKGDVGLSNVDNTSDAVKNTTAATLTNKTLTSPVINTPTGIVKADVGLSNVDNTSDAVKNAASATLTNKTLTAPIINSPTGIVKANVGLGNVDNTSDTTKNAAAVTLTNKTLTGASIGTPSKLDFKQDTFANLTTYALTASNGQAVYATDTKAAYIVKDAQLAAMGGAGGSGINYIPDPESELATTVWIPYADAADTSPVDGTGGSPSVTVSNSTSSPLRGLRSLVMVKDAANRQGNGIAVDFTIDVADKNKVLQISFDYAIASGTYVDNDVTFWIYDVTNAAIIQPAPSNLKNVIGTEKMGMEFQTSSSTSYRLIAHVSTVSTAAYSLKFDNLFVGPSAKLYGSPVIDSKIVSATSSWTTNSSIITRMTKIGDRAYFEGLVSLTGAPNAADLVITLPAGMAIDVSKSSALNIRSGYGITKVFDSSAGTTAASGQVRGIDSTSVALQVSGSTIGVQQSIAQTTPVVFANDDSVYFKFDVPIAGWSSSTLMSSDANTRVVAFGSLGTKTSTTTLDQITLSSVFVDTHVAISGNTYVVKVPGVYEINANANISTGVGTPSYRELHTYIDGINVYTSAATGTFTSPHTSLIIRTLKAGQVISFYAQGTSIAASLDGFSANIKMLSGPAQIAASESVNARYTSTASQSIPTATTTTVIFGTKEEDSHGAFNPATGVFTAPMSGKYSFAGVVTFNANTSGTRELYLIKSGTTKLAISTPTSSVSARLGIPFVSSFDMLTGETASISVYQNSGGAVTLNNGAGVVVIAINRVGN